MLTFAPPQLPTIQSAPAFTSNVEVVKYGDGYEQSTTYGLNPVSGAYNVAWDILTVEERDEIEAFFSTLAGSTAFYYTFPEEISPRKFKCGQWRRSSRGALFSLSADFKEVFDIATEDLLELVDSFGFTFIDGSSLRLTGTV